MADGTHRAGFGAYGRVLLLVACLAAGGVLGFVGSTWTGEPAWWLAVPAAVALGWLFVADPSRCAPPGARRGPPIRNEEDTP